MYSSQDKPKIILSWRLAQTSNILSQKSEIFFCSESPSKNLLHRTFIGKRKKQPVWINLQKQAKRLAQGMAAPSLCLSIGLLTGPAVTLQKCLTGRLQQRDKSKTQPWASVMMYYFSLTRKFRNTGINPAVHTQPKFQPNSVCNVGQFRSTHFKEVI